MAEPLPLCHLNGEILPLREARISPLDRSFLFGDGVYEVMPVYGGRPFRFEQHFLRLARSCREMRLDEPHSPEGWRSLCRELIERNGGGDQYVYLQVSRGAEYGRSHAPLPRIPPTVFAFCAPLPMPSRGTLEQGLACITAPDTRWARCDIKSVALLANVLLRQQAADAGASETILLRDGFLTEASASSVYVVIDGELRVPPYAPQILPGTTRDVTEELACDLGIPLRAVPIPEAELRRADEIWLAAATREVVPVTRLDGGPVGSGRPGPCWQRVYGAFQDLKRRLASEPW